MSTTVNNIQLGSTMVHEVPRGTAAGNPGAAVIVSENPTSLDAATDRFIRDQMLTPFIPSGREIIAAEPGDGDGLTLVPRLTKAMLGDHKTLPEHSRSIAQHLFGCQASAAPAGIFLASIGTANVGPVVIMLKAEHQEGVRLRHSGTPAHVAFEVEHITELIVGKNSKVYKIAMLWQRDDGQVLGKMVDKQNGVGFADYFLDGFLGMGLRYESEKQTRDLVDEATRHINEAVDPEKQTRYLRALVSMLESPNRDIDTPGFIRTHIDPEDRDAFEAALPRSVLSSFSKDTTLVKSRIGGMIFDLHDGEIQVRTTSAAAAEWVTVDRHNKRMVIDGVPEKISPGKSPKG